MRSEFLYANIKSYNMEKATTQFGVHYMLDGHNASPRALEDQALLSALLNDLPTKMGMHALHEPVVLEVGPKNRKDPGGYSGFVVIAESHISFHTFPKRGFISVDVYTCQNQLDTDKLTEELTETFKIRQPEVQVVKRGTEYPVVDIY